MSPNDPTEIFAARAMAVQRELFAYILTLVSNLAEADDVLGETNLVLWRKRAEYDPSLPIKPWAMRIAHYQVLAHRKRTMRDRLQFDDRLFEQIAVEAEDDPAGTAEQQAALSNCLSKLSTDDLALLRQRYVESLTAGQISRRVGRSADAIYQAMRRIRLTLLRCVERRLAAEQS